MLDEDNHESSRSRMDKLNQRIVANTGQRQTRSNSSNQHSNKAQDSNMSKMHDKSDIPSQDLLEEPYT